MDYLTTNELAKIWKISARRISLLCYYNSKAKEQVAICGKNRGIKI